MSEHVTRMSIEEMFAAGFDPLVNATSVDVDNPVAQAAISGQIMRDHEGRQVISWKQFQDFHKHDVRLEDFALRMSYPGQKGIRLIPATKYHKWYGDGFRAVGQLEETMEALKYAKTITAVAAEGVQDTEQTRTKTVDLGEPLFDATATEQYVAFRCSDKYPDCKRFFDNEKGLKFHWRKEHEGGFIAKHK